MSLLSQLREYELRMRREGQKPAPEGAPDGETPGGMPFMYALQNVRWEVRLNADGTLRDILPLSSGKVKGKDKGLEIASPKIKRSGKNFKAQLFMDNAEYALGIVRKTGDPNVTQRHGAFCDLVYDCADKTALPAAVAVANFLRSHDPEKFFEDHLNSVVDFSPDTNVIFTVDGSRLTEIKEVQDYWAALFSASHDEELTGDKKLIAAECLITGVFGPVMNREPLPIKGIAGGSTTGMAFISANNDAFESYGLRASQIAPVKFEAAVDYANGLNRLLADPATSMKTGGVTFAFWTQEGATLPVGQILTDEDFDPASLGLAPKPAEQKASSQQVGAAFSSPFKGALADFDPKAAFYAVGMTPSKSRVAVRTHLTTTVADTLHHLRRYFAAQHLVKINPAGKHPDRSTYDLYPLVSAMYRDARKEHTEPDVDALVQFALGGQPLPRSFLVKLNARNRVDEHHVTRPRAVLTKMVLLSREFKELEMDKDGLDALNPNQKEPAYHLGRLLAVLDDIQGSVMKANTTLVDRFYGSMSTTPYAVVGRLIHGSQAHLQKLRKENEPAYRAKQNELESVMSRLADIPARPLSTAQQALFALGYYHQRAHINEGIRERSAAKKEREAQTKTSNETVQPTLPAPEGDQ